MSKALEAMDRRAFLRGLTLTSAGLLVPRPVMAAVPAMPWRWMWGDPDPGVLTNFDVQSLYQEDAPASHHGRLLRELMEGATIRMRLWDGIVADIPEGGVLTARMVDGRWVNGSSG